MKEKGIGGMTEPDGLVEKLRKAASDLCIARDAWLQTVSLPASFVDGQNATIEVLREAADALSAAQRSDQRLRELWHAIRQTQGQIVPVLNDEMIPVSLALQWADQLAALLSETAPIEKDAADDLLAVLKAIVTPLAGGSFHNLTGENAQAALAAIAKVEKRS